MHDASDGADDADMDADDDYEAFVREHFSQCAEQCQEKSIV